MLPLQHIYRGKEFIHSEYFESRREALTREFLTEYPDFNSTEKLDKNDEMVDAPSEYIAPTKDRGAGWKKLKFLSTIDVNTTQETLKRFPTIKEIIDHFGKENIGGLMFSTIEANCIIYRHTGPENKKAKFIRIHVPLIIPEASIDDLGMEINGEVIDWRETFAFNNQIIHSVWNFTPFRRLILLIDLRRTICDMPPAPEWTPETNANAPEFPKTALTGDRKLGPLPPRSIYKQLE